MTQPFSPSHVVPVGGVPAWAGPDGTLPIVASLDPGLQVAVAEHRGDWARIVASNGWAGWVDGRRLLPLGPPAAPPPGPPLGPGAAAAPLPVQASPSGWSVSAGGPASEPARATAWGTGTRPGRRGPGCLGCFLILLVVVVGVPAAGLAAFRLGVVTPQMVLNLIGQGPGHVQVDNLRDDAITVTVADTSAASDAASPSSATLNSFDIRTLTAPRAGRYVVTVTGSGGSAIATCTLNFHSGDTFMFVVLPDQTILRRNDDNVSQGSELFVTSSSLCR